MKNFILLILVIVSTISCTSTPTIEKYANNPEGMWKEGKAMSEKGESIIAKGENNLEIHRKNLREGESLIRSGNEAIIRAREDYHLETKQIGTSTSPKEVMFEAKKLSAIGKKWENALEKIEEGNAKIAKAKKMQRKAHLQIEDGRLLMEKGNSFIKKSQQIKMRDPLENTNKLNPL